MLSATRLRSWAEGLGLALSALVPLAAAAFRAAATPQWRDDLSVVRGLGFMVTPGAGAVSALATQLTRLLPLGPLTFRAALPAVLAVSIVSALLYPLTRRVLDEIRPAALNPLLALFAALTAALSPVLQREATVAGGAAVACALALASLSMAARPSGGDAPDARRTALLGLLLALTALESPAAGVLVALGTLGQVALLEPGVRPARASVLLAGLALAVTVAVVPLAVRPLAPRAFAGLGQLSSPGALRALDVASLKSRGMGAWITDVGLSAFVLTWLGALAGLLRKQARWALAPLLLLLAADICLPAQNSGLLAQDPLAPLRALSVCAAAVLAAAGVQAVVLALLGSALPMARPAAALIVAFDMTLAAIAAEEGTAGADRGSSTAAEVWTEQAVERLPPGSLLLLRSEALAYRLWAARLSSGRRPDLGVVPLPLLAEGRLARALLVEEPALLPLLRDLAMTAQPTELALSQLADVRPVYVELDPRWDRRIAAHLYPERLLLRFAPQPLGPSDRKLAAPADALPFGRVERAASREDDRDEATVEILAQHCREEASVGASVGDHELSQLALLSLVALRRELEPNPAPVEAKAPAARRGARPPRASR